MRTKILITVTLFLVIVSLILGIKKNKDVSTAFSLIKENEAIQKVQEEEILSIKESYLQHILLTELSLNGTFLGLNNTQVSVKDVIRPDKTIAIFISDSACLDCHREFISLLFKYFYKEAVIIRLGPLLDNQEFLEYKIWGLVGCTELEKIVNSKKPLVAIINSQYNLRYVYLPVNSDFNLFEKYLILLQEKLNSIQ